MVVKAILACDSEGGIGKNGGLPWPHSSEDMKWFRECTIVHVVVMGRKTWESIPSSLPQRTNIFVTSGQFDGPDAVSSGNMEEVLRWATKTYPEKKVWVIGGANVYKQAFPFVGHLYLTEIAGKYDCDTHIDKNVITSMFTKMSERKDGICTFSIWRRI